LTDYCREEAIKIEQTTVERDLSFLIRVYLKAVDQVNKCVSSAIGILARLKKRFRSRKLEIWRNLKYGCKKDVMTLERIQRRLTKVPTLNIGLNRAERCRNMNLPELRIRRLRGDLIHCFKIRSDLDQVGGISRLNRCKKENAQAT
jgi:hypothetical protein